MHDIPGANVRDLVDLVGRWRITPESLLEGLPITMAALADPTTHVPLRVCEAIVSRALQLTHEPALALQLGAQMRLSSHGFLGFAAMTAGTLREAVELAVRFSTTRTSAIGLTLYVEGATASLVIEERTDLGALREFVVLALVVGIWQLGETLAGASLDGFAECAFPAPSYMHERSTTARLRFEQPSHRLVFSAGILELPLRSADAVATRLAIAQCERELAEVPGAELPSRVRSIISRSDVLPPLAAVARELGMSPRTLKRKLAKYETTFLEIRDELRRERARLLLSNRNLSIAEIAARCGYSEVSNFARAFRTWTGTTPGAYRGER